MQAKVKLLRISRQWLQTLQPEAWGPSEGRILCRYTDTCPWSRPTLTWLQTWCHPPWPHQIACVGSVCPSPAFDGLCFWRLAPDTLPPSTGQQLRVEVWGSSLPPQAAWSQRLTRERGVRRPSLLALDAWRPVSLWGFIHPPEWPGNRLRLTSYFTPSLSWEHFFTRSLALIFSCQSLYWGSRVQ